MAAETGRAFHVPFHRHEDAPVGDPRPRQRPHREPHHRLGPADERERRPGIPHRLADQLGDDPDPPLPVGPRAIDDHLHLQSGRRIRLPGRELVAKQEIRRRARADQDHHPPVTVAVAKRVIDDRPQRRQPQTPGDQQEIAPRGDLDGPRLSEGTAHPDHLTGSERAQGARHGAERPHGVHGVGRGRIAAHRNRRLAHAKRIQHVELAGGERAARRPPFQPQGHHVGDLVLDGADANRHGDQPFVDGGGGVHDPVR